MEWTERRLHWLFAALALVLGVLYAFVLPPLQTPDEHVHFFRAYDMSDGHLVAVTDAAIPDQLRQLARLFPPRVELQRRITPSELVALATTPSSEEPKSFYRLHAAFVLSVSSVFARCDDDARWHAGSTHQLSILFISDA